MYYIVRRAFRTKTGVMSAGTIIEPADIEQFKYRIGEKHIVEITEHNFEQYAQFFRERFSITIANPAERIAAEKAEAERIAAEKAEAERIAAEKAEAERIAAEKAEAERIAAEKAEAERIAAEKAEAERIAAAAKEPAKAKVITTK